MCGEVTHPSARKFILKHSDNMRVTLLILFAFAALTAQAQNANVRIDFVEPDRTAIYLPCAPGMVTPANKCDGTTEVLVRYSFAGPDARSAKLSTTVSGGRVVATGTGDFRWDLSGVHPGTYTATVAAEDRSGRFSDGKTITVTVERCPSCRYGDSCPTVELVAPAEVVRPGESFTITANARGADTATYNWTVSAGTIQSGQGTASVSVSTAGMPDGVPITVTLDLKVPSGFPACQTSYSETVAVAEIPKPVLVDEFATTVPCEDGNARLDSFFTELSNNPDSQGFIVIYANPERAGAARNREQLARNFMRFRNFDPSRITFVRGPYRKNAMTQFWRVPPGSAAPDLLPADAAAPPEASPETDSSKPYLYATRYSDGLPECQVPMYDLKAYAEALNTEPRSRGRIVIAEPSRANFNREMLEIQAELTAHGVAKPRVTFIYKYVRPNRAMESTELWVIPAVAPKPAAKS
jgi:hypothetical protein